ncbi:MAG: DUF1064 domain-containing protein [Methanogenium sp.]|jgi:hypothetical protein
MSKGKSKTNAIPTLVDGIQFKSKLEAYCHVKLKENNLKAKYEGKKFTVLPGFKLEEKKIQPITYTPDFVGTDFIIECKGYPNDSFPLRWKLFLYYLYKNKSNYIAYLPHTYKEVDEVIINILKKRENDVRKRDKKIRSKRYKQLFSFLV